MPSTKQPKVPGWQQLYPGVDAINIPGWWAEVSWAGAGAQQPYIGRVFQVVKGDRKLVYDERFFHRDEAARRTRDALVRWRRTVPAA